ncbi:MAG: ribonuclease HII [candidate division KSB1 bacterium]|nr:ribonuclease HII [candidate division KSB1 bacterium]
MSRGMTNSLELELERHRVEQLLQWERALWAQGLTYLAGVDEAGRGPLAGPVVAAAVIFPEDIFIARVNDSKKLMPVERETLYEIIMDKALCVGIGQVSEEEIDRINILQATHQAMRLALGQLHIQPEHILVDGYGLPGHSLPQTAIVGGDRKCFSIAAASIIAKVTRDRMMIEYDKKYPQYGFAQHKGYPTRAHIQAIQKYGLCPIHRRSYKIRKLIDE